MTKSLVKTEAGSCDVQAGSWSNSRRGTPWITPAASLPSRSIRVGGDHSVLQWLSADDVSISGRLVEPQVVSSRLTPMRRPVQSPARTRVQTATHIKRLLRPMNSENLSGSSTSTSWSAESTSVASVDVAAGRLQALSLEASAGSLDPALIESLMRWLKLKLRSRLPSVSDCPAGDASSPPRAPPGTGESSGSAAKRKVSSSGEGRSTSREQRKRARRDDDDQGAGGFHTGGMEIAAVSDAVRLACPFYKHNRRKYSRRQWRHCVHPGWETVHRIKEHIYRCHRLPRYQCRRCFEDLKTEDALNAHSTRLVACMPPDVINLQDGINDTQERSLRSKKRAAQHNTEERKWQDVYRICFPDAVVVPCPYQDYPSEAISLDSVSLLEEYQAYLSRELPAQVRRRLEGMPASATESELRTHMPQMISGLISQLYQSFRDGFDQRGDEGTPTVLSGLNAGDTAPSAAMPSMPPVEILSVGTGPVTQTSPGPPGSLDIDWTELEEFFDGEDFFSI